MFKTMKPLFLLILSGALHFGAAAQGVDEGIKMVKYERYTTAEKILQPLAATDAIANYYLGLAQLREGNKEMARATFSKYPDDAANKAGMATLAFIGNNAAEGQRLIKEIIEKAKKKDWQAFVWAGDAINNGGGNTQDAINYYQEAIKRGGDNVDARIGLGDAYLKLQGGGGEAMTNYENAVAKDPKNSLGYSRIGALWYAARNFNDALTNYAKAKDADPSNPLPYRDLANAYFYVDKFDLAKQNIEKYYELSDKTCDDRIQYANILFLAKDYTPAISKMQEVLDTCGEKPYMYRVLGYSQYETKDYQNALTNMRTFFQKQTDRSKILPSDYMYMGRIFAALKMGDSADIYYSQAVSTDTSAAGKKKTLSEIAESYRSIADSAAFVKSAKYYKMAIDAGGDKATATDYFYWGYMNYATKNYSEAATAFQQMETKFPDQPSATYWRARVGAAEDNEGERGTAVPYFTKWLVVPDDANYKHKPSDLTLAYQYLAIVAYKKGDKAATKDYIAKLYAIDPADKLAKQLEGILDKPAKTTKPATGTKPKK